MATAQKHLYNKRLVVCRAGSNSAVGLFVCFHPGYSEDGGVRKGEIIPEYEFAAGPICLDDENEFPPVSM